MLYTTGYTRNAIVHNGMLDPGTNLLTKPFSIEELAAKVRKILDEGRKRVSQPPRLEVLQQRPDRRLLFIVHLIQVETRQKHF